MFEMTVFGAYLHLLDRADDEARAALCWHTQFNCVDCYNCLDDTGNLAYCFRCAGI